MRLLADDAALCLLPVLRWEDELPPPMLLWFECVDREDDMFAQKQELRHLVISRKNKAKSK